MKRHSLQTGALLAVSIVAICDPHGATAVSLSGTVHYTGGQGPVSATRPIVVILHGDPFFADDRVDSTTITANGSSFTLEAPTAGTYYLACSLDADESGDLTVGDPAVIYNSKSTFPADPVFIPGSVTVEFNDRWRLSGIAGTVTYTGGGSVSENNTLLVEAFADASLTDRWDSVRVARNGGRYNFSTVDTASLYLRASFDLNGNRTFDAGEPYQIYNHRNAPPADPVVPGPTQTAIDFSFGDGTTCVGDCNGTGDVTVNELVVMVNIALDQQALTACNAGDGNYDGAITVNEIVAGVNNALNGCSAG